MIDPLNIQSVGKSQEVNPLTPRPAVPSGSTEGGKSFKDVLSEAVNEVQKLRTDADQTIKDLVAGDIKDVSQAMVAVEKADIAFQTLMTVRSKVLNAYEEIMRMQV